VHVDSEVPEATVDGKVERDEEEDGDDPVHHQVQVDNVHLTRRPHVLFLFDKEQALNFPLTVTVFNATVSFILQLQCILQMYMVDLIKYTQVSYIVAWYDLGDIMIVLI
jgi:hypothetical protein